MKDGRIGGERATKGLSPANPPKLSSQLEQSVNKGCDRTAAADDDEYADKQQDDDDREEPPLFALFQEVPKVFYEIHD